MSHCCKCCLCRCKCVKPLPPDIHLRLLMEEAYYVVNWVEIMARSKDVTQGVWDHSQKLKNLLSEYGVYEEDGYRRFRQSWA